MGYQFCVRGLGGLGSCGINLAKGVWEVWGLVVSIWRKGFGRIGVLGYQFGVYKGFGRFGVLGYQFGVSGLGGLGSWGINLAYGVWEVWGLGVLNLARGFGRFKTWPPQKMDHECY